jgi:hypothetical protein
MRNTHTLSELTFRRNISVAEELYTDDGDLLPTLLEYNRRNTKRRSFISEKEDIVRNKKQEVETE